MFATYDLCVRGGWTNYLVDILVLIVLVGFSMVCAKRGFIECFFDFVSTIAAILVALLLAKVFLSVTNGLFGLQDLISSGFEKAFLKIKGFNIDISAGGLEAELAQKNLPKFLVDLIVDTFGDKDLAVGTTLAAVVGGTLGSLALTFITWILLYFGTRFLLTLVKKILNALANKITLISRVNTVLGAMVGLVQALFYVYAALAILALFPSEGITAYFNDGLFVKWLYNRNLLNIILGWLIA
ncbi:MAG: CvpA family protein [Clostridia bacterium]|nr:CvpA family protein [Clostridia bacterium]